jgi:branched-chain amino acid transport system ATP-binding protein
VAEAVLEIHAVTKRFGEFAAVDGVSFSVERGTIHAVIGPNGAGKSTLLNLLAGELPASLGRMVFRGQDITEATADRRSRLGIGRTYQSPNTFPGLTCAECLWLAVQSRSPMRFFGSPPNEARVESALQSCGLLARAASPAQELSYGEQRQLEMGMVLALEPSLLLLDEPLAGLGHDEALELVDLLRKIARKRTLVLVEHDMDAVFALADAVTVLVGGRVLVTGTPGEIRNSAEVRDVYLGEELS